MGPGVTGMSVRTVITLRPDPRSDPTDLINSLVPSPILLRSRQIGLHWEIILEDPAAVLSQETVDALTSALMSKHGVSLSYEVREFVI